MFGGLLQSRWFYLSTAAILVIAGLLPQLGMPARQRPAGSVADIAAISERSDVNLLFILIDTLRADRLSSYSYSSETSPVMDALARTGVRFERTIAQSSWTKCSMASLWTGTYPVTNGVVRYQHALPAEATLPAEILRDAGFRTAGIFRNGWVAPNFGFAQGFDVYMRPQPGRRPENLEQHNPSAHRLAGSDFDVTTAAFEFLRALGNERWFLYLHYMDVHQYVSDRSSAKFGTGYSEIYDNAIHWVDSNVGFLLAELETRQLLSKTLIVIASDHGEAFYEHGIEGHARNLYREVIETPLLLSFPFELAGELVVPTPVENIDIWPTLLDLLGLAPLPGAEGRSLVPLIEAAARGEEAARGHRPLFAHLDRTWGRVDTEPDPIIAVTYGPYRLIHQVNSPEDTELIDLAIDPPERGSVAMERPKLRASLQAHAEAYLERHSAAWGAPPEVEIGDLELGQLRALGYDISAR